MYGLAADPFHTGASDRLFRLKGRPRSVELPVLVGSEAQALALCTAVPASARRLMRRYWPGPLTLVLPRRPDLDADLGEEDATIGIRCPAHPVPLAVCEQIGPIATTSANRHKEAALTTAQRRVRISRRRAGPRARRRSLRRAALYGGRLHGRGAQDAAARAGSPAEEIAAAPGERKLRRNLAVGAARMSMATMLGVSAPRRRTVRHNRG